MEGIGNEWTLVKRIPTQKLICVLGRFNLNCVFGLVPEGGYFVALLTVDLSKIIN